RYGKAREGEGRPAARDGRTVRRRRRSRGGDGPVLAAPGSHRGQATLEGERRLSVQPSGWRAQRRAVVGLRRLRRGGRPAGYRRGVRRRRDALGGRETGAELR